MRTLIMIGLLCVAGCNCNKDASKQEPTTQPAKHAMSAMSPGGHPVIVHIVSRDTTVTISAGPNELLYSLINADGTLIVADAGGEQFERQYPELYERVRGPMKAEGDKAFLYDGVVTTESEPTPVQDWAGL